MRKGTDRPGDAMDLVALTAPETVETTRVDLWKRLLVIQELRDVTIRLSMTTLADLMTASVEQQRQWTDAILLFGAAPVDLVHARRPEGERSREPRARHHGDRDVEALALARAIADHIRRDPSIVDEARRYVARRIPSASPGERLELEEWKSALETMSNARLRRFLTEDSDRATRLRQSLPFLNVLSPRDRDEVISAAKGGV